MPEGLEVSVAPLVQQIKSIPVFKHLKSRQRRFILAYAATGEIQSAAPLAGCSWPAHYKWLEFSPNYRQAFEKAKEMFGDFLESEVFKRAFTGEDRPIWSKGAIIGSYKHKSDILAMFALKGLKPQYRDSFNPQGSAAPIALSITYPGQPTIDVTPHVVVEDKSKP